MKSWKSWVVALVTSVAVASSTIAADAQNSQSATQSTATLTASSTTSTSNVAEQADLAATFDATTATARFAIEVLNLDSGASVSYGTGSFDTASIVKVDILAALLFHAQEEGRSLTAAEKSMATAMIERSDNTSATTLFSAVGGEAGLEEFNASIGLVDTDVGSDGFWGLTTTTVSDQIRLLGVMFGDGSVLTTSSQAYAEGLMSNVVDSQNFGVSTAADDLDSAALKVGYLQRSATGLWDVTSIGKIERSGVTYLVAVLSDGSSTYDAGVALVDDVSVKAVASMVTI